MLLRNVRTCTVKELIGLKPDHTLSDTSLTKLRQKMVVSKFKKSKNESTSDKLLRMMEDDPNTEFYAYFGNLSEAEQTVWRVRKCTSKKRHKKRNAAVSKKTPSKPTLKEQLDVATQVKQNVEIKAGYINDLDTTEDESE